FSSRRRHTRCLSDWSSDVCSFRSPPTFRQNQFGASFGGPIKKDKLFFFGNFEGLRRTQVISSVVTVPDACAHQFLSTLPGGACEIGRASCRERGSSAVGVCSLTM